MALGQEELGRRIKEAREQAKMTQRELADAIDLRDAQSISNYERGITEVPTPRLRRIAEATKQPLAFFLGPEDTEAGLPQLSRWQAEVLDRMRLLEEREEHHGELLHELLQLVRGRPGSEQSDEA
jgi:transcriptional regulator with XRE-family HTH domain